MHIKWGGEASELDRRRQFSFAVRDSRSGMEGRPRLSDIHPAQKPDVQAKKKSLLLLIIGITAPPSPAGTYHARTLSGRVAACDLAGIGWIL